MKKKLNIKVLKDQHIDGCGWTAEGELVELRLDGTIVVKWKTSGPETTVEDLNGATITLV